MLFASHECRFLQTGVESSQHRTETLDAGSVEHDDSVETDEESPAPVETVTATEAQTLASRSMGSTGSLRQGNNLLLNEGGSSLAPVRPPAREYVEFVRVWPFVYFSWSLLPKNMQRQTSGFLARFHSVVGLSLRNSIDNM